jgi:hypothetical protein
MPKRFFTATLAAALVLPALAHGHELNAVPDRDRMVAGDEVPIRVERALGGEVTALPTGLYEVESPRGYTYTTHGPDPKTEEVDSPLTQGAPERAPACVSDPATDYYQEVLYGYPTNGANDLTTHRASIQAQIRRNNWLINESSLASGGPEADFKVRCEGGGEISVTAFPVTPDLAGTNASFTRIVNGAQNAGFTNARVDYTIFYDSNGPACGVGYFFGDESAGAGNLNNNPGFTGAGYGVTYKACWFGRTSIHENAHNQGAAQYSAPNSTGNGAHCNEFNDILCYVDGGDLNQGMIDCPLGPPAVGGYHYDCSWNTYFDAAPEPGEWLSNHWNIGSPVNRFIRLGSDTWAPDTTILTGPGESTTEATFTFTSSEEPATFGCSLVAAGSPPSFSPCASPKSYTGISDGTYEFSVRATDSGGNTDPTPATSTFGFDAPEVVNPEVVVPDDVSPPQTTISAHPPGVLRTKRGKATVRFAFASSEHGSRLQCRLDGVPFSRCTSPHVLEDVGRGKHLFAVRAIDAAGNVDPTPATYSFKVKRKHKRR